MFLQGPRAIVFHMKKNRFMNEVVRENWFGIVLSNWIVYKVFFLFFSLFKSKNGKKFIGVRYYYLFFLMKSNNNKGKI